MYDHQVLRWQESTPALEPQRCLFSQICTHLTLPFHFRHEIYANGLDTGSHLHQDFYALYVVQAGQGIHKIDQHPYGIARGDVYLLSPGTLHAYSNYHALEIDSCYFQPQLFSHNELAALQQLSGFWRLFIAFTLAAPETSAISTEEFIERRLHLTPEYHSIIETMLSELRTEFASASVESSILVHQLFFRLLVYLARWQATQSIPTSLTQKERNVSLRESLTQKMGVASILQFCEEHYAEQLTVPQLAAMMFLSPSRFSALFSHEVGVSPAAYIRRLRLEHAQTLLRTTSHSSTAIAHEVGFTDGSQFSRAFQAVYHLSPTTYRARFR